MNSYNFKSDFLAFLNERGLLHQCSSLENLDQHLASGSRRAYIGFDCTASSLHVGSLLPILLLKYLQDFGHQPVILLGGGTTLVGDPSGKDTMRQMLDNNTIADNLTGIQNLILKFLNQEHNPPIILNNAQWLIQFNYLEFLRDYGTQFTINRMLTFDSVKLRLDRENPLSFLEFNYMLLQAVDFAHLYKTYNVTIQMGGSDQWGNIINGVELIRRKMQASTYALTAPLILKSDGSKMGKSADGAIWMESNLLSPWDFYQYFRNVDDKDVIYYLKIYTTLPINEINKLAQLKGSELNEAKKILAFEVTKICHGLEIANKQQELAHSIFVDKIDDADLPTFKILPSQYTNDEIGLTQILLDIQQINSKSEGRKLIQNKGIKINNIPVDDINYSIKINQLIIDPLKISIGKKKHFWILGE